MLKTTETRGEQLSARTLPRDAQLLAALAEPLEPQRPPFYIKGSTTGHPDGWYWIPAQAKRPSFLGRNVIFAERKLLELHRAPTTEAI